MCVFCRRPRGPLPQQPQRLQRRQLRLEEEKGPHAPSAGGTVPRVRRPRLGLPLQRPHVRRMQGLLQTQHNEERGLPMQVRQQLRDRHVHAAKVPGVPVEKVPQRRDEARMCGAGSAVRRQEEREKGAEGEGQAEQHDERLAGHRQSRTRSK